jgi:hypothetical protein
MNHRVLPSEFSMEINLIQTYKFFINITYKPPVRNMATVRIYDVRRDKFKVTLKK